MFIYLALVVLIILAGKNINKEKFTIFDISIIVLLSLVCGLRYYVGSDYLLYKEAFENLATYERMELGITSLINVLNFFNLSYATFLCIMSFSTISIAYIAIKKHSETPYQSVLLFMCMGYYAMCFNGIRQMLAVAICLFSLKYLFKKDFWKYLVCIIIAGLCHYTSLVMIPLYFLVTRKYTKKQLTIFFFFSLAMYFLYEPLLYAFTHIFTQYSVYYYKTPMTYGEAGPGTYIIGLLHLVMGIFLIKHKDELIEKNDKYNVIMNLYFCSLPFYVLSFCNTIVARFTYYFAVYEIFLIPQLLNILIKKKSKGTSFLLTILFVCYYVVHLYSFNQMLPYEWIFGA